MTIFVHYHIDKNYFIEHKKDIVEILNQETFKIACMKFEKQMSYQDIAKQTKLSGHHVRKILSSACDKIRKQKKRSIIVGGKK